MFALDHFVHLQVSDCVRVTPPASTIEIDDGSSVFHTLIFVILIIHWVVSISPLFHWGNPQCPFALEHALPVDCASLVANIFP